MLIWHDPQTQEEVGRLELRHDVADPAPARAVTTHEATIPAGVTLSYAFEREDDLDDLVPPS